MSETTLAPLREYAANVTGGERSEAVVGALDRQAQRFAWKALKSLWPSLRVGVAVGVLATIADVLLIGALVAQAFGAALFGGALIAGSSAALFVLRGGHAATVALQNAFDRTWGWANALGTASDRALAPARTVQDEILRRVVGGRSPVRRFTDKARLRAQLVMGLAWALIGLACVLAGIGFYEAATGWWDESPANPSNPVTLSP